MWSRSACIGFSSSGGAFEVSGIKRVLKSSLWPDFCLSDPSSSAQFFFGNDMARTLSCPPTAVAVYGVKYQNWFPIAAGGSKHSFDYKAFAAKIEQNPPTCLWGECRCGEMSRRRRVALWFHVCRETNPAASPECRERERRGRKWTVGGTAAAELPRDHA